MNSVRLIVCALLLVVSSSILAGQSSSAQDAQIKALEQMAKTLDKSTNVDAREFVEVYFKLGRAYIIADRKDDAMEVLKKGLRLQAWNYEDQIILAMLEIEKKGFAPAIERLRFVVDHCENPEIRNRAEQVLMEPELKTYKQEVPPRPKLLDHKLYLLRFKGADPVIVEAIASRIAQEFSIRVEILDTILEPDKKNLWRNREIFLNGMMQKLKDEMSTSEYHKMLEQAVVSGKEASSLDDKENVIKWFILQHEEGERLWQAIKMNLRDQYNATVLLRQIRQQCRKELSEPKVFGILGITHQDIYARDYNFLFGWTNIKWKVGVMSCARFYDDQSPWDIVIKRAVMQAFSSTGHIIGIKRCTSPTCARAYAHSLEEHDCKDDKLCSTCLSNLRANYERRKQASFSDKR